jgi:hypothetical protein
LKGSTLSAGIILRYEFESLSKIVLLLVVVLVLDLVFSVLS